MGDDLYQNDGETYQNGVYYPGEPEERKEQERVEAGIIASSYPIITDVADWFAAEIAACDSLDNIQTTSVTYGLNTYDRKVSIEAQVLAYQLLKEKLAEKAKDFDRFRSDHDE